MLRSETLPLSPLLREPAPSVRVCKSPGALLWGCLGIGGSAPSILRVRSDPKKDGLEDFTVHSVECHFWACLDKNKAVLCGMQYRVQ